MKIGNRATLAEMDTDGWQSFAKDVGLGFPLLRRRIAELSDSAIEAASSVAQKIADAAVDHVEVNQIAELLTGRAKLVGLSAKA
jgi:serine/threonine-protein kinase HipA